MPTDEVAELRRQLQLARSSAEASRVRAEAVQANIDSVWDRKKRDALLLDRLAEMLSAGQVEAATAALARRRAARERSAARRAGTRS